MPFEIVQRPSDSECPTEVSVRWDKDQCFVQLKVERSDELKTGSSVQGVISTLTSSFIGVTAPPYTPASRIPVGTVKAAEDGSQVAIKAVEAYATGSTGEAAVWTIIHTGAHPPKVERCYEPEIQDWPIVSYPDDRPVAATIWTQTFSRGELNNFIRTLRRARDAAYGADA